MAIAIDATTYYQVADSTLDNVSFSHTCAGSDRYMLLGVLRGYGDEDDPLASGPTYNGVSMTLVAGSGASPNAGARVDVYELVAPATGAHNIAVGYTGTGGDGRSGMIVRSFTGVDQTTPRGTAGTATAESTTASTSVSSAVNELVVDFMFLWSTGSAPSVGAGQTERVSQATVTGHKYVSSDEAGASSVTMSWTQSPANDWAIVAVPIKPASAGAATLEQEGYRWYADDGSESGSTALAAQDTGLTQAAGTVGRIRFAIDATGDPATKQYKLQYKLSTDSDWSDIA